MCVCICVYMCFIFLLTLPIHSGDIMYIYNINYQHTDLIVEQTLNTHT